MPAKSELIYLLDAAAKGHCIHMEGHILWWEHITYMHIKFRNQLPVKTYKKSKIINNLLYWFRIQNVLCRFKWWYGYMNKTIHCSLYSESVNLDKRLDEKLTETQHFLIIEQSRKYRSRPSLPCPSGRGDIKWLVMLLKSSLIAVSKYCI